MSALQGWKKGKIRKNPGWSLCCRSVKALWIDEGISKHISDSGTLGILYGM